MKSITVQLKKSIHELETIQERLEFLKEKYKDDTVYIITCGPSLNDHNHDIIREKLKDKLVICIKQSYDIFSDITDFHVLNTYNLKDYNWLDHTITLWGVGKYYQEGQLTRILQSQYPIDLYVPVLQPPYISENEQTARTKNFDDFLRLGKDTEVMWGPAVMYELAIPLSIHLGCSQIVTIGWDIGDPNSNIHGHFGNWKTDVAPRENEIIQAIESTYALYDWCTCHDINFTILSKTNPADPRFTRLPSVESL